MCLPAFIAAHRALHCGCLQNQCIAANAHRSHACELQQTAISAALHATIAHFVVAGSASAVTAALQEVAVLASMANAAAAGSNSTATSPSNATNKVTEIQNALLTTLTTVMDTSDPAAMDSSLNAAKAVSSNALGLSPAAGQALLDVVAGFVSANVGAKSTSMADEQVRVTDKLYYQGFAPAFCAIRCLVTDLQHSRSRRCWYCRFAGWYR
jgi:hypothetical protein